jgi:hypothetical protein
MAACGFVYMQPLAQTVRVADDAPLVVAIRTQTEPSRTATRFLNGTLRLVEIWKRARQEQESDPANGREIAARRA